MLLENDEVIQEHYFFALIKKYIKKLAWFRKI